MRKFAFVLNGFAALAITLFVSSTSAIEEPTYSLITAWDDPEIEIRDYDARILATTQMNEGQNSGFQCWPATSLVATKGSRRLR